MNLRILLPFQIFAQHTGVSRIVAETSAGSLGLLPHRLDCVAALVPGILAYETPLAGIAYIAVDEGVLVKSGGDVRVSVRRAIGGANLDELHGTVRREFALVDEQEREVRTAIAKMEASLMAGLAEFSHGRR
jgi:F-type H+-transporting ATPase subunit epsilon